MHDAMHDSMHGRCRLLARWTIVAAALVIFAGCKEQLHSHVTEREANEMVATLYVAGIRADKVAHDEKSWSVEVDHDDVQRSLLLLQEHGLPHEQFANTGELFKKEGLVSTPSEERIRYMYAVSQELSHTLSEIDGVMSARVHLVMPANDPLASHARPASASVFIKHRSNANVQALSPAIKNLVRRGIEGLEYENIALTFVPGEEPLRSVASPAVGAAATADRFQSAVTAAIAAAAFIVAMALGYLLSRLHGRGTAPEPVRPQHVGAQSANDDWTTTRRGNAWSRATGWLRSAPETGRSAASGAQAGFARDVTAARRAT